MDIGVLLENQYKVIEHIGRGGMADVWSARDQRLRRMVAVKTIVSGLNTDVDPVTLFEREAQTIAQLEHPHILPIYGFGEYDNSLYIVMRYVTGGSLEEVLRSGPMQPEEVLRMGEAIAQALDYAHDNNVIHLDLKPPNILLDSAGSPYLADFGLATVLDPQGRAHNPGSGTLLYMAPEQMVSEIIDHRADIYSFCIMLFHMLTGQLPFDGNIPLAMKQLQSGDELPYIDEINESLPHELNELLRDGTATEPFNRPDSHMEIMEQFRNIIQPSVGAAWFEGSPVSEDIIDVRDDFYSLETARVQTDDSGLLEAIDLFSRARYNWQGGQGRFLMGVTHFMLMNEYYREAEFYNLTIDEHGLQVLLRGAIEFDHDLQYWWDQVAPDSQRWVCLHTLRGGATPARIRALYRLETLPDDANAPVIPRLVAQALEIENDNAAKIAALSVLGTRAKLIKRPTLSIMTQYRGRLLTSFTRFGIQLSEPGQWQEAIYSSEVDTMIAEQAFDDIEQVAEYAARTIGKMRSLAGVTYLADAQRDGRPGALEALAFVRDETPGLPDVVSEQAKFYAWITNTVRRLTDNPLDGILHFILALIGGWIAMGEHVYNTFRGQQLFNAQRWGNTIAVGMVFGLFIGVTYVVTGEMSKRLKGFWPWWLRLITFGLLGFLMGTLSFGGFTWMYYQYTPLWDMMRMGGFALAFAFVMTSMLDLRGWHAVGLTTVMLYLPLLGTHRSFYEPESSTIVWIAPIGLFIGIFVGWRATYLATIRGRLRIPGDHRLQAIVGGVLGLGWAIIVWLYYSTIMDEIATFTWNDVTSIFIIMFLLGTISAYLMNTTGRIATAITALAAFAAIFASASWVFFNYSISIPVPGSEPPFELIYADGIPLHPIAVQPIFHFDEPTQIFSVTLPMVFLIALGANLMPLLEGWSSWIGRPVEYKEQAGWMRAVLIYILVIAGITSVLALFSAKESIIWALGWSLWSFMTFILAFAAFRWARWGAQGLLLSAISFLFLGFVFDTYNMYEHANLGSWPELLSSHTLTINRLGISWSFDLNTLTIWGIYGIFVAVFAWGALRNRLWAGIGLVTLIISWYFVALFSPIHGSVAVFAMLHVSLVAFALKSVYQKMEEGRFSWPRLIDLSAPAQEKPKRSPDPATPQGKAPEAQTKPVEVIAEGADDSVHADVTEVHAAQTVDHIESNQSETNINTDVIKQAESGQSETNVLTEVVPVQEASVEQPTSSEIEDDLPAGLSEEAEDTAIIATQEADESDDKPGVQFDVETRRMQTLSVDKKPKSDTPSIKINTGKVRSQTQEPGQDIPIPELPQIKFDTSKIRNQRTVQFREKGTPPPAEESNTEDEESNSEDDE